MPKIEATDCTKKNENKNNWNTWASKLELEVTV
jgi:hypothetical protein